ncbi:MAG: histidine phosphatase family protein [Burkholderiaceae bacterium]
MTMPSPHTPSTLWVWRHPKPDGVAGRCVGRTDVPVDPRRSKRLARRIQATARREHLPRVVFTSPLRRAADVGRWLRRWGWAHRVDAELLETDFGRWDGLAWAHIARAEVDAWCADFAHHAPGGGEPLVALLQRAAVWAPPGVVPGQAAGVVVGHAGWMLARRWAHTHGPAEWPQATDWPPPPGTPGYGVCWRFHEFQTKSASKNASDA